MYHKRARVWGCERIQGVSWIYDSLEVIPSSFRKEIRYNRILFSFYWNCRTIFVARSFQFFNTGIFLIIYSVDVAWRVKTFFEILGVFRNMSVEIWRGCPLYVAATSNLNVHISKLGGWKIYIYIYMLHWRGAISKTFQRFIFRLHDYAGNLLFNFWSRKKEKLINFIIPYFAIYFK